MRKQMGIKTIHYLRWTYLRSPGAPIGVAPPQETGPLGWADKPKPH